jgi:hypothetical protein
MVLDHYQYLGAGIGITMGKMQKLGRISPLALPKLQPYALDGAVA